MTGEESKEYKEKGIGGKNNKQKTKAQIIKD